MTRKIWTEYRPSFMRMGGNVWDPMSTEIEVLHSKVIKGIGFFSFVTPNGSLRIVEGITGGIIASSFDEVYENTKGCSQKFLLNQINEHAAKAKEAILFTNDEFFKHYKF